ncbi:MAG: tetratricopeptide repeat protein, partial [Candidatus Binatia bacterium]
MIAPILFALLVSFPLAEAADAEPEGVCAYAAGRFGVAAFTLVQSNRDLRRRGAAPPPVATYLLGRAFRELGMRGLALRHLGDGESRGGSELRLLARRELARIHFDAADPAAVLEVWERTAGKADAETSYLAGLAAAQQRDWPRAAAILSEVASTDDLHPYARYARAQSAAAGGDLVAALADLEEVVRRPATRREPRPPLELAARDLLEPLGGDSGLLQIVFHSTERSVSLGDRAQLLRGKILYLAGRT